MARSKPFIGLSLAAFAVVGTSNLAQGEANRADQAALPDLGRPAAAPTTNIRPSANPNGGSVAVEQRIGDGKLVVTPEYSNKTGSALGATLALPLADNAALGLLLTAGADKNEFLANAGFGLGERQRVILSLGQLRQKLEFDFVSGRDKTELAQNSGALSYQHYLGKGLLNSFELNGYRADTASRSLADKNYAIDTASLYELWNDRRRIAGGNVAGFQGRLVLTPLADSVLKLGLGGERLDYDLLAGKDTARRFTGNAEWTQRLGDGINLKLGADAAAAQNRYAIGLERSIGGGQRLGVDLAAIRGRLGAPDDNQIKFSYTFSFGGRGGASGVGVQGPASTARLLDQVAQRPSFIPAQVVAKLDTTAAPQRLVAVDKTTIPAGANVNAASGAITAPLGMAIAGIVGVTRNGAPFANSGQFALAGNNIVINPNLIAQPAVGVVDVYVVTANNVDGGTTLVTVNVSHGSVKIDSIRIGTIAAAAPTASAVGIVGTAQVGQTLTGSYIYADANNDPQGTSTFRWLRNGVAIAGATAVTYTLVAADQGKTIAFEVTPVATVVPTTGTPVVSSATAAVVGVGVPAAPTASAVGIVGTAQVGQVLTGQYTYADVNNDPQGTSTFRWLRNGVAIAGATASTYTLVAADQGNTIAFEVTPVATVAPTTGTPVASSATAAVAGVGIPAAPTAANVAVSGTAQVGQTLTGSYTYADANNDPQGTSTFRWLRNGVAIAGATATTYTLVAADQGNTIAFEVTPVATVAPTTGTPVASSATAAVAGVGIPAAPTAANVAVSGTAQVGQTLTGSYAYADANNDPQGTSTFRWLRNGVAIAGATASSYTLVGADQGKTVTFEVTPVATVAPTTGTPVVSSPTATVAGPGVPAAPTASAVNILGTAQVGQTLTGSYTYADANNDPQGTSTFRWLRNGVAIAGATATTYTLVAADQGSAISFEVTPVSTVAPTTGAPVTSSATAAVAVPAPPTASAVSIVGTAQVGQTLAGSYTYADANGDPQGTLTFRWLRNGAAIAGATASTYTLVSADQGSTIAFEVTPVATMAPTTGTPVVSSATATVAGIGLPAAPTASTVSILGTAQVGQVLTGSYAYADANNDPQGTSIFRWLRNGVAIAGATASSYTLVAADQGSTISFEVTPVATAAPTTGFAVVSNPTATVAGAGVPAAPTAGNVTIGGTAQVGQKLTGNYSYADANSDPQGITTFRWLRNGVAIAGATASTYTLVAADQGKTITFEVTPVSTVPPTTGTPVVSSATAAVVAAPAAPTASGVSISGTAQVGQILTGSYTYADANGDPQGTSTFRWLRNGVAIAGATATTYTLIVADQGNMIAFEVTPVSTVAPTTGTPVVSSAVALAPGAPAVTANDDANTISLNGIDGATLEVSTTSATAGYAAFNAAATYAGNQTVWVRVKAAGVVPASAATQLSFTEVVDAATTITAPTLSSKTTTTIVMTPGTFSDADGTRNVVVEIYNSGCAAKTSEAASGNFSGLISATTYGFKTKGEAMNGASGQWEAKASSCVNVATDIPPVSLASMVDGGSVAPGETKNLVITLNNLAANYSTTGAVTAALSHSSTGASTGITVTWSGIPDVNLAAGTITYTYMGNDAGTTVEHFQLGALDLGTDTINSTAGGL